MNNHQNIVLTLMVDLIANKKDPKINYKELPSYITYVTLCTME
jgi:hypothetical protein